jgi:hypothetical protein
MVQHFLLSPLAKTLSLAKVMRMSDEEARARTGKVTLRWSVARSVARRRKPQGKGLSARPVG